MINFFWRTLSMYTPRYQALVRVESMDFDPMVNRYFEAQFVESGENTNSSQSNGTNTGSDITSRENIIAGNSKEYPKTSMRVSTEGETHSTGSNTSGPITETETYNSVRDAMVHSGTVTDAANGTANESGSLTRSENSSANSTSVSDGIANAANKAAPMSASGLTYANSGTTLPSGKDGQHLNNPDLSFATEYSHTDSINGTRTNSSGNGSTTEGTTGTKTTADTNVKTMANSDTNTKTGSISKTKAQVVDGNSADGTNESVTVTSYDTGSVIEKENTGTDTESINVTHNGTASTSQTDSGTHSRTSTNRYTGREGLTPQEGMMSATDYLMNYSVAFKWLVNKLDSCFIMLYDV